MITLFFRVETSLITMVPAENLFMARNSRMKTSSFATRVPAFSRWPTPGQIQMAPNFSSVPSKPNGLTESMLFSDRSLRVWKLLKLLNALAPKVDSVANGL